MNPIIKYLDNSGAGVIPQELFETLRGLLHDEETNAYVTNMINSVGKAMKNSPEHLLDGIRIIMISSMAVGYLYGSEGSKSPADIATEVLKELNIKEGA